MEHLYIQDWRDVQAVIKTVFQAAVPMLDRVLYPLQVNHV